MPTADLIIHARWIIPVEPDDVIYEHHALAVRNGRIQAILPSEEAHAQFQSGTVIELPSHALIPGLINTHTHAAMTQLRGLAEDMPLKTWLNEHIWPAEARWMSAEFVHDGSELAIAAMVRSGTTCFSDMYFFPEVTADVVTRSGMRACIGLVVVDFPSAWGSGPRDYLTKGMALRDQYKEDPLLSFAFAPHAPYTVAAHWLKEIRTLADELELPIHTHLHETTEEIEQSLAQYGKRPLARLAEMGFLGPNLMAVHMTQLTEPEIVELSHNGVHVIHCPESNLKLASGFCPVAQLLAAGVNVALGTDGAASNNDLDLLGEMRTAALLAKGVADDAAVVPVTTAIRMATLNGARALGLDGEIGSLLPGKWADLAAVDLNTPECQPVYNPLSQLVYAAPSRQVTDVWVAGRQLLRRSELTCLDVGAILQRAQRWQQRITGAKEPTTA